jgi:hypothetical protein
LEFSERRVLATRCGSQIETPDRIMTERFRRPDGRKVKNRRPAPNRSAERF